MNAIERVRAEGAESSESAILVGNRAGVVEWANLAWSRITGFPLVETVHKPISHFLDVSGIELELVDFVGQRFVEGRSSTLEFPFETFEGQEIHVHLEVEPIRNRSGELDAFVATASILPEWREDDPSATGDAGADLRSLASQIDPTLPPMDATAPTGGRSISISEHVRRTWASGPPSAGGMRRTHFDLILADELPTARLDSDRFGELMETLQRVSLLALGDAWGCISVMTGTTRPGRGHVSQAHPVIARPIALARGPWVFVEIHDTGRALPPSALERVCAGQTDGSPREVALARSVELAREIGVPLHLDSTPGCGNQALVLIPISL